MKRNTKKRRKKKRNSNIVIIYMAPKERVKQFAGKCKGHRKKWTKPKPPPPPPLTLKHKLSALLISIIVFFTLSSICYNQLIKPQNEYIKSHYYKIPKTNETQNVLTVTEIESGKILGKEVTILLYTSEVTAGDTATLRICGESNRIYHITLHLKSGISTNSALITKQAGEDGRVEWNWKVSNNTTAGTYRLVVTSYITEPDEQAVLPAQNIYTYVTLEFTVKAKA